MHLTALTSYLQGLREHNNKAWFVMNKPAYDILRPEFITLVAKVIAGLGKVDRHIADVDAKKALFRIYRDIRFSNDKTPYKTYFSASIAEPGVKHSGPMYYLSINADGVMHLGAGCWMPSAPVLANIRRHVVADHAGLLRIARNKTFVATFGALSTEDRLARLPKGFDPKTPGIERYADLLRLKSIVATTDIDLTTKVGTMQANDLVGTIVSTLSAATPLDNWLRKAVIAESA